MENLKKQRRKSKGLFPIFFLFLITFLSIFSNLIFFPHFLNSENVFDTFSSLMVLLCIYQNVGIEKIEWKTVKVKKKQVSIEKMGKWS